MLIMCCQSGIELGRRRTGVRFGEGKVVEKVGMEPRFQPRARITRINSLLKIANREAGMISRS